MYCPGRNWKSLAGGRRSRILATSGAGLSMLLILHGRVLAGGGAKPVRTSTSRTRSDSATRAQPNIQPCSNSEVSSAVSEDRIAVLPATTLHLQVPHRPVLQL